MYYTCELLIGGYVYPITGFVKNWEDIKVSFKRNDYDGVVRTFSDNFEFVKGARTLLLNEYYNNYLNASASIVIYTRNNSWIWTEVFRCALNYSTLKDDGYVLSMNAIDNSVASLIKAKKGTQYEYYVNEVKDSIQLDYDRLEMLNNIKWVDGGTISEEESNTSYIEFYSDYSAVDAQAHTFPMYTLSQEISNKNKCEFGDMMLESFSNGTKVPPFFKALENLSVHLAFSFQIYGTGALGAEQYTSNTNVMFIKKKLDGSYEDLGNWSVYSKGYRVTNVSFDDNIELSKGESLALIIGTFAVYAGDRLYILNSGGFNISFYSKGDSVNLDVIKPVTLLNRLLKSMNGGVDELTGVIVPSGEKRLDNAMLLAAESARQIPGAKIYTSFTKFCDWMKAVFGYVYDINGNTITFRHRDDYFGNNVVKTIENYTGYTMNINSSLIYSQVRIGYEKQDYNSVNGKDEFRFTNEYTTGITITDNKLELISPYRADAYGIEFLAEKIGEDTTDNESDTDIFFVCAYSDGEKYKLDRSILIQGVISPETMFNVMYAPSTFIFSNFSFLGSFISEMTFASSEGNTSVKIAQNAENRNIQINQKLFSVSQVEIETSDIELPKDLGGIVELTHQGRLIQGYYISADYTYTKSQSSKITLVIK